MFLLLQSENNHWKVGLRCRVFTKKSPLRENGHYHRIYPRTCVPRKSSIFCLPPSRVWHNSNREKSDRSHPTCPRRFFPGEGVQHDGRRRKERPSPPNLILGMPYGGRPALTVKLFPRPVHPRLVEERSSLLEFYFGMPLGEKLPSLLNSLCAPNLRHPREGGCRHETSREPSPKNRREGRPERVGRLGKQSLTYYVSVVFSERVVTVL